MPTELGERLSDRPMGTPPVVASEEAHRKKRSERKFATVISRLFEKFRRANAVLKIDTWVLSGKERASGADFCFAFSGLTALKEYQARISFVDGHREVYLGKIVIPLLPFYLKLRYPKCSIAIVEIDQARGPAARFIKADLKVPVWMPIEIEVEESLEKTLSSTQLKMISRKIRSNHLSCEVKTDPESFDDFYFNMYLPFIKARHGSTAMPSDYGQLRDRYRFGELVMVKKDDRFVGGYLIDFGHQTPRLLEMGVRDGLEEYMKLGVPGACYYFSFARILERGGGAVVLGTSRAYLKDGPLNYKLSLGARFAERHYERTGLLYFRFLKQTPGLQGFLIQNPFIALEKERYFATYFGLDRQSVTKDVPVSNGHDSRHFGRRLYVFHNSKNTKQPLMLNENNADEISSADILFHRRWLGRTCLAAICLLR